MSSIETPHYPNEAGLEQLRDSVIEALKLHYAYDNIDDYRLGERLEVAEYARTEGELQHLLKDLPELSHTGAEIHPDASSYPQTDERPRKKHELLMAVMGGSDRRGVWRPAHTTTAIAVMGGVDLDFRSAVFPPGRTHIRAFCMMGGIDIVVPPGVEVELSGVPILGGIDNRSETPENSQAPILSVHAVAVMGGVDIRTKALKKGKR